jgi:hypothetical protein
MKKLVHIGLLLLFCLASRTTDAKRQGSAVEASYDFYQVSLQAVHCKVKVLVNGIPNENLSMDGSHSSAASAPFYRQDLKTQNTITLQVEGTDADARVTLNVQGISSEREVVSTNDPGNIVALDLDAKQIPASKTKSFSARFRANFRESKPEPASEVIGDEEARTYARYFVGLLRSKDVAKLTDELLPFFARSPEAKRLSDAEARQRFNTELLQFLDGSVFVEDRGSPIEVKPRTTKAGKSCELVAKGGEGLVGFYAKNDREKKKSFVELAVAKRQGKIQVVEFRLTQPGR